MSYGMRFRSDDGGASVGLDISQVVRLPSGTPRPGLDLPGSLLPLSASASMPASRRASPSRRWVVLGVVACAYTLSFFQRFAPAGIAQDLAAAFQTSAASLGALAATYFYVYTVMQVPTGIMVDTLGPRLILLLGGLVAGAGSILFGLAHSLPAALVGRTVIGLGVSVTFIAMLKLIAVWFEERRFATLVGAAMVVGNLGSVLAGAPLSLLAQQVGWRIIFTYAGVVSVVLSAATWVVVRDRPEETATSAGAAPGMAEVWHGLWQVVRNRVGWPAALVNAGIAGSFFAFGGLWAMPFLTQGLGLSRNKASAVLSLYFAGFAVGCLVIGAVSDRLGRRRPVAIVASLLYALIWLFWLTGLQPPPAGLYALFAAMGFTAAAFTLTWACAKEVNPPRLSGISTSVANMGGFLAGAILQPLVGWVLDLRWSGAMADGARHYSAAEIRVGLALLAAAAVAGCFSAWRLRETNCRNIWRAE